MVAVLIVFLIGTTAVTVFKPKPAEAQCVCGMICTLAGSGVGRAIQTIMSAEIVVEIANTYSTLSTLYDTLTSGFNLTVTDALTTADNNLNEFLDSWVAYDLIPAMKAFTKQDDVMMVAQSQQLNAMQDGRMLSKTLGTLQGIETTAFINTRPNQSVCVGGTISGGLVRGRTITQALGRAMPLQNLEAGGNVLSAAAIAALQQIQQTKADVFPGMEYYRAQTGGYGGQYCSEYTISIDEDDYNSAAAGGAGLYQKARMNNYYNRYCNPLSNGGSGCPNGPGPMMDGDILVMDTLFESETIDLDQDDRLQSVNDLVINLIEPEVPNIVPPSTFSDPATQEELLQRRSFRARRVLAKKAIYDVAARRAPGTRVGPYVETLRLAAGVELEDISENPSLNEIVNALVAERFWTGTYNLSNVQGPAQVDHEKLTLQAVELMELGDYLDQLQNLSMMLAAQVANETIELGNAGGRY